MHTLPIPARNLVRVALVTIGLLLLPLVATQFTDQVDWNAADFAVMGTMLFVTGLLIDLAVRRLGKYRLIATGAILFLFLWLWAELAVGVFTNWGS